MDEKLDLILNKLNQLEKKIDKINEKIDQGLLDNCQKMSDHIDFIETVYDNVKNPLGFLCNKLNVFSGNSNYTLENLRESPQEDDESSDD
tara:strand:+ start:740 stop:1009 length:270 start_codon:yes stop_codon:yes gene_type:complete